MTGAFVESLSGGLRVAVHPVPGAQSVCVGIWANVGGRHDPAGKGGLAHFLEHMVFRGTRRRAGARIVTEVESLGGEINAFTAEDHTCYYAHAEESALDTLLDVLGDVYVAARLAADDTRREASIIIEEIRGYRDQPATRVEELMEECLWPGHALGRPVTGDEQSIRRIRSTDLRRHRKAHYTAGNSLVVVAGAVDGRDVLGEVARSPFGGLRGVRPRASRGRLPVGGRRVLVEPGDVGQCHIEVGFRAFGRRHGDRYALRLLSVLLAENMGSFLFQELRERLGLCYHVQSEVSLVAETGSLTLGMALDPANVPRAMEVTRRHLARIAARGVAATRIRAAARFAVGQMRLAREGVAARMNHVGESMLGYGRIVPDAETEEGFRRVTAGDVRRVAAAVCDWRSASFAAVCGPRDVDWLGSHLALA